MMPHSKYRMSKVHKRNLLLLSNSTLHGSKFLEWAGEDIKSFLVRKDVKKVLFVPYAIKDMNCYTETTQIAFKQLGFDLSSIHLHDNPINAVNEAEAIFIGGGNTFRLLKLLYDMELLEPIRKRVLEHGIPYIGSSAGTNVATLSINTTNDMPIVYPSSFTALKLVPFNINPHYVETDHNSTVMSESRDKRIQEYHEESEIKVLALKEGSYLIVQDNHATIGGHFSAKLFKRNDVAVELKLGEDVSYLL